MAERIATGQVDVSASRLGALIAGLAVVVQNSVWRAMDNALPASIGEGLDCLTGLALAMQASTINLPVERAALLAAARLLGSESDAIGRGHATPHDDMRNLPVSLGNMVNDELESASELLDVCLNANIGTVAQLRRAIRSPFDTARFLEEVRGRSLRIGP